MHQVGPIMQHPQMMGPSQPPSGLPHLARKGKHPKSMQIPTERLTLTEEAKMVG